METGLWFYRPPMKLTAHINFKGLLKDAPSSVQHVCSIADASRRDLLTALGNDPEKMSPDVVGVNKHLELYLSILAGALQDGNSNNFLQESVPSSWSETLIGSSSKSKSEKKDVAFEYCNILFDAALWLAKRAAYIVKYTASSPTQTESNLKEAFQLLKAAAGMMAYCQTVAAKLKAKAEAYSDMESKTLTAYENQFLAEAQEIVLRRAMDAKQAPDVIAPLAADTSRRFSEIATSLQSSKGSTLPPNVNKEAIEKLRKYADLKKYYWQAISRCYQVEMLLASSQAGQAIRCVEDSKAQSTLFSDLAAKNRGTFGIPNEAFHGIAKLVENTADKCNRENVLLHHQKAAPEIPALCSNAQFGLAASTPFTNPEPHAVWADVLPKTPPNENSSKPGQQQQSSCSVM